MSYKPLYFFKCCILNRIIRQEYVIWDDRYDNRLNLVHVKYNYFIRLENYVVDQ
jgi:hypothetical protein